MSVDEYARTLTPSGRTLDPELALFKRIGLYYIKSLPDYFSDEKSLNYGALLVWDNPVLELTKRYPYLNEIAAQKLRFV